jgi:hypothetical protein
MRKEVIFMEAIVVVTGIMLGVSFIVFPAMIALLLLMDFVCDVHVGRRFCKWLIKD